MRWNPAADRRDMRPGSDIVFIPHRSGYKTNRTKNTCLGCETGVLLYDAEKSENPYAPVITFIPAASQRPPVLTNESS